MLKEGKFMLNFPMNSFIPKNQKERNWLDLTEARQQEWFKSNLLNSLNSVKAPVVSPLTTQEVPISQKFSKYSRLPYGLVGTVGDAGCGPLAVEYALRVMGFSISFEDILHECVSKGYRAYVYSDSDEIIDGAGTEHLLFSNLAIRLSDLNEIFDFLKKGCPITLLVSNAVYHGNPERKGNHFVTLIGIDENENALIMDGNLTACLVKKPLAEILLGINNAWAWEKTKMNAYLE